MKGSEPVLTVGELTLDDVIVEDRNVDWKQAGGGALYSAVGASLWSTRSAVCATVGRDYPGALLDELTAAGLDLTAVQRTTECNSLGLWLLYESSGARHQYQKSAGGSFRQLDALRPRSIDVHSAAAGIHLAPQSSEGHATALADLADSQALVTLDLLVEPYIDTSRYTEVDFLSRVDAFLPSVVEVIDLWGHDDINILRAQMSRLGFDGTLVIKRGPLGVDVATSEEFVRVPAAPTKVLDVTGAGDAFCGASSPGSSPPVIPSRRRRMEWLAPLS